MRLLMVLTSHDQLGDTGKKTGFWLEEFAAPYYVFKDAGAEITLASPKGGQPPLDPSSDADDAQTEATKRFKADEAAQKQLANTAVLSTISSDGFDAIFYPGGHGPLWDLEEEAVGLTDVVPFLVENMLISNGGNYHKGGDWASFVVTDGKLVTGQNPASSEEAARKLVSLL
jgi:putative intracellular protease/amidase